MTSTRIHKIPFTQMQKPGEPPTEGLSGGALASKSISCVQKMRKKRGREPRLWLIWLRVQPLREPGLLSHYNPQEHFLASAVRSSPLKCPGLHLNCILPERRHPTLMCRHR